ncbi:MAG: hypothetical protein JXR83_09190 [Deltaproteobacteria bacterium]|nr:hypothetical protein [Deltaproteobacteria bacterium]
MVRTMFSLAVIGLLLGPGAVSVASAKTGKAEAAAAKAEAKAKAKEAAKAAAKAEVKAEVKQVKAAKVAKAKDLEAAKAAVEEMKKEAEKATWNQARLDRISKLATAKNDAALTELVGKLKAKEDERHKLVTAYYEPLAAKAPPEEATK